MENQKKGRSKKENAKEKGDSAAAAAVVVGNDTITSKSDLKSFLFSLRDRMTEKTVAPIYAVAAINHVLTLSSIHELLDNENKELARDIWLRIKQSGMQIKSPPILFGDEVSAADQNCAL